MGLVHRNHKIVNLHSSVKCPTLQDASIIVNNLIQNEIQKTSHLQQHALPDINEDLNSINPLLLEFLTDITISVRDRGTTNATEYIKKVCLFFILNQLKFCTNPKMPTLIHNVIVDVVEMCGGSRLLICILNRLGCATFPDTHDKFVTHHAVIEVSQTFGITFPAIPSPSHQ